MSGGLNKEGLLLKLIDAAYAAADDHEMMRQAFEGLRMLVPFNSGVFMPVNQCTMEMQPGLCFDCEPEDMATYLKHYAPMDPFVLRQPGLIVLNENRRISDVISTGELDRSEFIDFMQQVPYRHAMGALTGLAHRAVAVVSVHRQGRDFNQEELAVFDRVGPHLARAVVLRRLANDTLQRAETGIAVFAGNGRALYLSEPARRFIGRTPAEALFTALSPEGSGVIRIGSQSYRLSRLPWSTASLLRHFALEDGEVPATPLGRVKTNGHSLSGWPEQVPHPSSAMIVVMKPFAQRTDLARRLAQYGLSPRQSEIAACALRGLANTEIAREVCIGEQTVRDHFQEIYGRIGVSTRPELLARLLGTNTSVPPVRRLRRG